jgi:hypothetical protein
MCGRRKGPQTDFIDLGPCQGNDTFNLYRRVQDEPPPPPPHHGNGHPGKSSSRAVDWNSLTAKLQSNLTAERRAELAAVLGLPEACLAALPIGLTEDGPHGHAACWTFPEMDGAGQVCGLTCRYRDGTKKDWPSGRRGLYVPAGWDRDGDAPLLIAEGPSDVLAGTAAGLTMLGRPNNTGGAEQLAELLQAWPRERGLIVLGELDAKSTGDWPGRDGAVKVATAVAAKLNRPVSWALPPDAAKDLRSWLCGLGLDAACSDSWSEAGQRFLTSVRKHSHLIEPDANGKATEAKPLAVPRIINLSTVKPRKTVYNWKPWLPQGTNTIVDGDPGLGKSTLSICIAARLTRGQSMPPGEPEVVGEPMNVLMLSAEDDLETTVIPRLIAAGADMTRVHSLEAMIDGDDERPPVLPWDLIQMEEMIRDLGIGFTSVDPFMAYLDPEIDAHRDQDVRRCMARLRLLAERTRVTMMLLRHLNKLAGGPAIYRGGGSIGIGASCRSALAVGKHPSQPDTFVLTPIKINGAAKPKALTYTVVSAEVEGGIETCKIQWGSECDLTSDDILAHNVTRKKVSEECADAIRDFLGSKTKKSEDLDGYLQAHGFSPNAIKDGRRAAGVMVEKVGYGEEGAWMVFIPPEEPGS